MKELGSSDLSKILDVIGDEIVHINLINGWDVATRSSWDEVHKIPTVLALIHSEVSEALEAFREQDRAGFSEEMADVFIRLLDLTHGLGIDLGEEILKKLEKNKQRGYRHGGKKV